MDEACCCPETVREKVYRGLLAFDTGPAGPDDGKTAVVDIRGLSALLNCTINLFPMKGNAATSPNNGLVWTWALTPLVYGDTGEAIPGRDIFTGLTPYPSAATPARGDDYELQTASDGLRVAVTFTDMTALLNVRYMLQVKVSPAAPMLECAFKTLIDKISVNFPSVALRVSGAP